MNQLEIWALPGHPLREADWLASGYTSLQDYVEKQIVGHTGHMPKACKVCQDNSKLPLVTFGQLLENGQTIVLMNCNTVEDLPTQDIEGVVVFNKLIPAEV